MKNWKLRSCKKCGGDLIAEYDEYKKLEYHCLQCSAPHNFWGEWIKPTKNIEELEKGQHRQGHHNRR